jgi:hypothetical protein
MFQPCRRRVSALTIELVLIYSICGGEVSRQHVDHGQLRRFAEERVNLPAETAKEYRDQAYRLGDKLEAYLADHPTFSLRRLMLSGSLAKGTSLRTISDIDMALYVQGSTVSRDIAKLIEDLAQRLRTAFPNFAADQVKPQTYSITVSFKGTGLDVDIVPIIYDGKEDWRGDLVSQDDGSLLETSIPLHIAFAKKRKSMWVRNYAETIRLAKFWTRRIKSQNESFRFKSFMVELIMAKLADDGCDFSDYVESLQSFFTYIAKSGLSDVIVFSDYYKASAVTVPANQPVKIIDPVNPQNNVSRLYTSAQVDAIVTRAEEAGEAIDWAISASTKQDTVAAWQRVFGPSFQV